MSASDTTIDSVSERAAPRPVRPFYWSVRRELWENQAIWIAPLAVAALVIVGSLAGAFGAHHLRTVRHTTAVASQSAEPGAPPAMVTTTTQTSPGGSVTVSKTIKLEGPPPTPEQRRALESIPFYMVAAAMAVTMFLVAVFYCLGGLYNERRDRSILFWKSLPVPDLTTVASKMVAPMAILPLVTFAMGVVAELLMLTIGMMSFASHAQAKDADVAVPIGDVIAVLGYGLVALTLWWAPFYAWLLMISGWAKRAPFLWAVLPPLGLALAEKLAFDTTYVGDLIASRVFGGYKAAFVEVKPQHGMPASAMLPQIDAEKFVSSPGLWLGLLAAAAILAAAVWMRRRREPV